MWLKTMMKAIGKGGKIGLNWAKANSNWLLAAFAALGVTITAAEAIHATVKAVKLCEEKQVRGGKEVLKTVWKLYIPMVGYFLLTTITILGNARVNAKRIAAATSLIALTKADAKEFKEKAKEMLGESKVKKIEDEQMREKLKQNPYKSGVTKIVDTGHGTDVFMDYLTGQRLYSSIEYIEGTEADMNLKLFDSFDQTLMVSYYLRKLHLETECRVGDMLWDAVEMQEFKNNKDNNGHKLRLIVTPLDYEEIDGRKQMVHMITPSPLPTGP